jgi:hypothetical protein
MVIASGRVLAVAIGCARSSRVLFVCDALVVLRTGWTVISETSGLKGVVAFALTATETAD